MSMGQTALVNNGYTGLQGRTPPDMRRIFANDDRAIHRQPEGCPYKSQGLTSDYDCLHARQGSDRSLNPRDVRASITPEGCLCK